MCPADCGNRIHEGDIITHSEHYGGFVHVECAPQRDPYELAAGEVVCPDCWLTRPCKCDQ